MNYNEATGGFGRPSYFSYGNRPALATHFEGITARAGGFDLVAMSSAQYASMAFVPVTPRRLLRPADWYPVSCLEQRSLCSGGCSVVTGNTVYQNQVMGLYAPTGATLPGTYLATIARG